MHAPRSGQGIPTELDGAARLNRKYPVPDADVHGPGRVTQVNATASGDVPRMTTRASHAGRLAGAAPAALPLPHFARQRREVLWG
ncbi:hypothetical protein [Ralstonia sp. ASV6]|uniref:hypothetical protein n=1 Tax=Ralstonia sp. ASV6 TaxID=2795124 RepID=UPI0018EC7EDB|nr:hypothetical protein [Ralstonia sp. ASV6]